MHTESCGAYYQGQYVHLSLTAEELQIATSPPEPVERWPLDGLFAVHRSASDATLLFFVSDRVQRLDFSQCDGDDALFTAIAGTLPPKPPRFHVLLNPVAGGGNGKRVWEETVEPMLKMARVAYTFAETTRQALSSFSPDPEDALIVMSGDTTLHDILNALLPSRVHRIGIIPTGTGNALALSLDLTTVASACARILRGRTRPLLAMHAECPGRWSTWAFMVVSFGFHCQVVWLGDRLRWLFGRKSYLVAGRIQFLLYRRYVGDLSLAGVRQLAKAPSGAGDMVFGEEEEEQVAVPNGKFVYFVATKQHSLERGFCITPLASPSDMWMDVLAVDAPRKTMGAAFVKVSQGQHVAMLSESYYKARRMEVRMKRKTRVCLDGKFGKVPAGEVLRVEVKDPGIRVFC
ncbi:uncharacterized protein VTP21DRAFT_8105 [Calcarisporiella thermophila]|uniref:uncharacterized protein n=1 Tax=Calcarisporiella thermophila TaxID=911321 RepID=UPI003743E17B